MVLIVEGEDALGVEGGEIADTSVRRARKTVSVVENGGEEHDISH
jgi:hypothetical protein